MLWNCIFHCVCNSYLLASGWFCVKSISVPSPNEVTFDCNLIYFSFSTSCKLNFFLFIALPSSLYSSHIGGIWLLFHFALSLIVSLLASQLNVPMNEMNVTILAFPKAIAHWRWCTSSTSCVHVLCSNTGACLTSQHQEAGSVIMDKWRKSNIPFQYTAYTRFCRVG